MPVSDAQPPDQVNIHHAKTHLSRLVEDVAAGAEVLIAKGGKPMARFVPLELTRAARRPGLLKGKLRISEDFDQPLPWDVPPQA